MALTTINRPDSEKLLLGTGEDLQLWHDGSNSRIKNTTGSLYIIGDNIGMLSTADDWVFKFSNNGATELYYDGSKKLETTSTGISVTSNVNLPDAGSLYIGNDNDLRIHHSGSEGVITNTSSWLKIFTDSLRIKDKDDGDNHIVANHDGSVELYYDGSKKFETTSGGVKFTGNIYGDDAAELRLGTSGDLQIFHNASSGVNHIYGASNCPIIFSTNTAERCRITSSGDLNFENDSSKITLGTGQDLQIYHSGSSSWIYDNGTGDLNIGSNGSTINMAVGSSANEIAAKFISDGAVELYYDNSKKLYTYGSGVVVTGLASSGNITLGDGLKTILGDGEDLQIYHDGSHSYLANTTGNLYITEDGYIELSSANGGEKYATFNKDGAVELYHDNVIKINTNAAGVTVSGNVDISNGHLEVRDDYKARFGNSQDLQIWHDAGAGSNIKCTGTKLEIRSNDLLLQNVAAEKYIRCISDGAVELYYDNSKKFQTTSGGAEILGHLLMNDSNEIQLGSSGDLKIYHDGNNNKITTSNGSISLESSGESMLDAHRNGAVALYYDNSKKIETTSGGVTVTGSVTETSDIALKTNITPIDNVLDKIQQITGYTYQFKDTGHNSMGVTAQDVEKVFPELVHGEEGSKTLQYSGLIGALIESVKELSKEINTLKNTR